MMWEAVRQLVLALALGALLVTSCTPLDPARPSGPLLPTREPVQGRPSPSIEIPPPIR